MACFLIALRACTNAHTQIQIRHWENLHAITCITCVIRQPYLSLHNLFSLFFTIYIIESQGDRQPAVLNCTSIPTVPSFALLGFHQPFPRIFFPPLKRLTHRFSTKIHVLGVSGPIGAFQHSDPNGDGGKSHFT